MGWYAQHVLKGFPGKNIVGKRAAEARSLIRPPLIQEAPSGSLARLGTQLDWAAIARMENILRRVLAYELRALASALAVEVNWLIGGVE